MQTIFIMVKCDMGQTYKVAATAVEEIGGVSEVHSTSGKYDLMMKCYLDDDSDIGHFVTEQIQSITGVADTFTIMTFKTFA